MFILIYLSSANSQFLKQILKIKVSPLISLIKHLKKEIREIIFHKSNNKIMKCLIGNLSTVA